MQFSIPLRTVSALNVREHFQAKARRVKQERQATAWILGNKPRPALPCVITMTRFGPSHGLDDDNLVTAFKGVRDQIAEWLGIDDKSPLVTWQCEQARAKTWSVGLRMETV